MSSKPRIKPLGDAVSLELVSLDDRIVGLRFIPREGGCIAFHLESGKWDQVYTPRRAITFLRKAGGMAKLFQRRPESLTKADIEKIVGTLAETRRKMGYV